MKRLLFILSCLMIVSLSYADTVYGRLEKLEGNSENVWEYFERKTSQGTSSFFNDTMDTYLNSPIQTEKQDVVISGNNTSGQVDKIAARRIINSSKYVALFFSLFCLTIYIICICVCLRDNMKRKIQLFVFGAAVCSTFIWSSYVRYEHQRELVDYGRVLRLDVNPPYTISCVILDEQGNRNYHNFFGAVFEICFREIDDSWSNPTTEAGIFKEGDHFVFYQSFGQGKNVMEATIRYVNEKVAKEQCVLKYITCIMWGSLLILCIYFQMSKFRSYKYISARNKVETARLKVEKKRQEQKLKKQPEYRRFCEELVTKFWVDYLDSPEDTAVLLARLKVALQNSGYLRWQEEFYDFIETRVHESTRPSKEQRQKANSEGFSEEFGDIRINFNGIFVTPAQYRILSKNEKAQSLSPDELIVLCRKLAEKLPEFRDFLEGKVVRTTQMLTNANEAYELFKLTPATLTEASLKQAYRRLVQQYHPDKNKDPKAAEMFQKVRRYYAYLEGELRYTAA